MKLRLLFLKQTKFRQQFRHRHAVIQDINAVGEHWFQHRQFPLRLIPQSLSCRRLAKTGHRAEFSGLYTVRRLIALRMISADLMDLLRQCLLFSLIGDLIPAL